MMVGFVWREYPWEVCLLVVYLLEVWVLLEVVQCVVLSLEEY